MHKLSCTLLRPRILGIFGIFAGIFALPLLLITLPLLLITLPLPAANASTAKSHTVTLGSARRAVYTPADAAPATAAPGAVLRIRPLNIDGRVKEWTTGDAHDLTDRTFSVRRAVRVNDSLPGETAQRWIWQSGPWLLVDRQTGHITILHLPDYDPDISDAVWYRDYAAYCGINNSEKMLYAVVARAGTPRPVVLKEIAPWQADAPALPACASVLWQRAPIRVTFQPTGHDAVTFEVTGTASTMLEEPADNDSDN